MEGPEARALASGNTAPGLCSLGSQSRSLSGPETRLETRAAVPWGGKRGTTAELGAGVRGRVLVSRAARTGRV